MKSRKELSLLAISCHGRWWGWISESEGSYCLVLWNQKGKWVEDLFDASFAFEAVLDWNLRTFSVEVGHI